MWFPHARKIARLATIMEGTMLRRRALQIVAIVVAALLSPFAASDVSAQSGTIRVIVGVPAGGAIDPYARMIAEHMSKTLNQPVIVESKVGASGNIAAQYIADQPA